MIRTGNNAHHIGSDNFNWPNGVIQIGPKPQLSEAVVPRPPQAAITLDKQSVHISSGNGCDASSDDLFRANDAFVLGSNPQWSITSPAEAPYTAVVFQKYRVVFTA